MAGGVLVEQGVEEHRLQRADPAGAVDERELAEARGAVVLRARRAQRLGVLVGVDLDGAAALELDPEPSDDRAVELERQGRADVPVDPQRIGGRERLLARDVRVVREVVDRRELGGMPDRRRGRGRPSGRCPARAGGSRRMRRSVSAVALRFNVSIRSVQAATGSSSSSRQTCAIACQSRSRPRRGSASG